MKILLIGPQGSGKSTQGRLLEQNLQIPYISTGDIFRQIAQQNSEEGKKIKQILESGQLVDDQTTARLLEERVKKPDCQNGFILDGYPRNLEQVKLINLNFDKVFFLNTPKEVALDRLLKRGRSDDTEESITKRLTLYYQQTEALLDYYKNQGILAGIDGRGEIQSIQDEIKKSL
ncbi:nucleoside monophosphate kinase [Candidatus Daviesbacteria bacterium]|nr:nucleoside monophosphate kinase [Candidatus Daviesbacteria bacterium]